MFESDSSRKHALECLRLETDCRQLAFETDRPKLASHFARMARVWAARAIGGASEKPVVLVVEDEPIIRLETMQTIKDAGYAVVGARDTNDAMSILKARRDICAVFTEIRAPGRLNGMDLCHAIAERWPLVRLMVTSSVPKVDNLPANWRHVPKPYNGAQIVAALRSLLAARLTAAG